MYAYGNILIYFSETVINKDITWNENHTLSYTPERSVRFEPEHSIGNPEKDMVNVINIPLLVSNSIYVK